MLIVSRYIGESVILYPDPSLDPGIKVSELFHERQIMITITDIQRNQARIGIDAPEQISIVRLELIQPGDWLDRTAPK